MAGTGQEGPVFGGETVLQGTLPLTHLLDQADCVGCETRHAPGQLIDPVIKLRLGEGPVHKAIAFGLIGIKVTPTEHEFHGPGIADQARPAARPAPTGNDAEGHLGLSQTGRFPGTEAHIERRQKFKTTSPGDPPDLAEGRLGHLSKLLGHGMKKGAVRIRGRIGRRHGLDQGHISMGNEEIGVCALNHDHPHLLIFRQVPRRRHHVGHQGPVKQVEGRVINGQPPNMVNHLEGQCLIHPVWHGLCLPFAHRPCRTGPTVSNKPGHRERGGRASVRNRARRPPPQTRHHQVGPP